MQNFCVAFKSGKQERCTTSSEGFWATITLDNNMRKIKFSAANRRTAWRAGVCPHSQRVDQQSHEKTCGWGCGRHS